MMACDMEQHQQSLFWVCCPQQGHQKGHHKPYSSYVLLLVHESFFQLLHRFLHAHLLHFSACYMEQHQQFLFWEWCPQQGHPYLLLLHKCLLLIFYCITIRNMCKHDTCPAAPHDFLLHPQSAL